MHYHRVPSSSSYSFPQIRFFTHLKSLPQNMSCFFHSASLPESVRTRLPGGRMFDALNPRNWDSRYGTRVSVIRILSQFGIYFLTGRVIVKKKIAPLRAPYPTLYHFTPKANAQSILTQGILPRKGVVWLTDRTNSRWLTKFSKYKKSTQLVCFKIDTARLVASGHPVEIINYFHEFNTDYVPADCITPIKHRPKPKGRS